MWRLLLILWHGDLLSGPFGEYMEGNMKPLPNTDPNFDEAEWITKPPPWPLGGPVGENPQQRQSTH